MDNPGKGPQKPGFRVGIDLGTTNSLISVVRADGVAEILPSRDQEAITPSVIGLPRRRKEIDGQAEPYLIGRQAVNNAHLAPENTISSIKRFIGLPFADPKVQVAKGHVVYTIQAAPGGGGALVAKIGERLLTPEEVSALVLRQLKEDAEARLGGPVTQAVITVPAYFEEHRRRATRNAGALAGLTVLAILDEPTAAAISESVGETESARVLVFDFGGGTLDISLIVRAKGNLNVISYGGDNFLGGVDIDRAIVGLIKEQLAELGADLRISDKRLEVMLHSAAEAAKKTLAVGRDAEVSIPSVGRTRDNEILDLDMVIDQAAFLALLAPLLERVRKLIEGFLKTESLQPAFISEVLMVGGSSAVTPFQTLLRDIFDTEDKKRVKLARSPMEAVAKGAALFASRLKGLLCPKCGHENDVDAEVCTSCGTELNLAVFNFSDSADGRTSQTQPLPRSLGVAYRQGDDADAYQVILKKGTQYPTRTPVSESFQIPSGERFQIQIREGEEDRASRNAMIGVVNVEGIPSDVARGAPVVVAFSYTRNRTLHITLEFPTSKQNQQLRWDLAPPDGKSIRTDDPVRSLTDFLPRVRGFASKYDEFMDPGARKIVSANLDRAQQAVLDNNRQEAERLERALAESMWGGCGIASTLFLAENTIANEDAKLGPIILEAAAKLREQHTNRDPAREETRRALEDTILKALANSEPNIRSERLSGDSLVRGIS